MESIKYFPGIMSENITLVSKEYTSRFVTGPELQTELSKKQDNVGLSLDDMGTVVINGGFCQAGYPCDNIIEGTVNFYGSIYDKDGNEITGGGSKWVVDESGMGQTWVSLGKDKYGTTVNSVFVSGPLYDKDGKEITGGGGGGGGGETKAKKWYCNISMGASDCKFWNLTPASESEIESIKVIVNDGNNALITFKEEKSMNEVNEWLIFRAKLIMGMEAIYDAGLNYFMATAICPWPEDKPWPESN